LDRRPAEPPHKLSCHVGLVTVAKMHRDLCKRNATLKSLNRSPGPPQLPPEGRGRKRQVTEPTLQGSFRYALLPSQAMNAVSWQTEGVNHLRNLLVMPRPVFDLCLKGR